MLYFCQRAELGVSVAAYTFKDAKQLPMNTPFERIQKQLKFTGQEVSTLKMTLVCCEMQT